METLTLKDSRSNPRDAVVIPFPRPEITPPVTNMNLVSGFSVEMVHFISLSEIHQEVVHT